ncbi:tRNA adenosine(34) deaminase TadA [Colwellia sp. 4_MG-2023]|jgi:tRNA(adenine34) deaminase|uniref:tRNA adenosine(34) deaminase TadA n=1 Tax=unclassified Colwellia TaxID=196834 RepID=UPI001C0870FB|nr:MULTISPECIES: tRNA adenosine(34) deaminase TadA [unclassified Colwellia]MBU2923182.1 tRNA adenosine(34) deaminase TadA [Colwellia sp. C2M11]MDO6488353.1 tRNA adenosine(34) deaminase TadA [Colwellia sp. 6_MG-2023]MDO6506662.1 tRNA adenosine(34) deaminase TadA [Colwellia sp. 5_MG-2023]MDO6555488.1 tRNA adenosine(34) deaminase TadA [Colwellia sp. 4_MG-2023]MDO6651389.1 tRNA adenosine(34) deaminase TadA [Colwellia sp. 3_MG-2023]
MTTDNDLTFMQRAYELAQQAEQHNEIPVGAVVVYQGDIIGEGFNQSILRNDPSAHAEMIAIRQAGKYLNNYRLLNCTLYVTLEPCPMCAGLLVHSRIQRLVYASPDLKTGAAGSIFNLVGTSQLNHQIEVDGGIMVEQCSELLSGFFKRRRSEKKLAKKALKLTSEFK